MTVPTPDVSGTAAGVPFVAYAPDTARPHAPVVVTWHLLDAPSTERAMAAALPLAGVDGWRIHLGLPMTGGRGLPGGQEEVLRLGYADAVRNLHVPIAEQAAAEFPAAFAELHERFAFDPARVALVGGSAGAAVAQLVLTETARDAGIQPCAAVLVSPVVRLKSVVDAVGRTYGIEYPWDDESLALVARLDFVQRADEIVAAGAPAIRFVVGAGDDDAVLTPAAELRDALTQRYAVGRVDRVVVADMGHAFADEPGVDPAPQTAAARQVDRLATEWLQRHLMATGQGTP